MERKFKDYALLSLKGMAMGAADVVPGVSGGTIAFIVGIYDELINSIKSVNPHSLKLLFTGKVGAFWKAINGNFLFFLLLGIAISVFSLARLITYLLVNEPVLVWAFFFGLVLASTWFVSKDIKEWNWKTVVGFLAGAVVAYYITVATPAQTPDNLLFIFFCGVIAICAMILPGISGSFILVLLGKYLYVMEAVKTLDFVVLGVFAVGCVLGITSFSHVLSFASFPQHHFGCAFRLHARFAEQGVALERSGDHHGQRAGVRHGAQYSAQHGSGRRHCADVRGLRVGVCVGKDFSPKGITEQYNNV